MIYEHNILKSPCHFRYLIGFNQNHSQNTISYDLMYNDIRVLRSKLKFRRYQIMLSCWHPNPHSRPTFNQLKQELEKLLEETMSYIDLSVEVSEDYFNESTNE